jgi:stearoyl-CoA desaturase (delta-9 desaturase)
MDPHSPKFDRNILKIMWHAREVSNNIYKEKVSVEPRFLKNLPDWRSIDRIGHSTVSRISWMLAYVLFYVLFAPSAWFYFLLPVHFLMVPVQGVIINWFAHKYGSVNFPMKNTSTNLFKFDLLMMGEAYHNNHHKNPSATNFGFRWHEVDPTYIIIRCLNRLKIIRIHHLAARQSPVAPVGL